MQNSVMNAFMTLSNAALRAAFCLTLIASGGAVAQPSAAVPFITLGDKPAVLYDALSAKANKLFILPRNQPLEVLVKLDKWTKVREPEGAIGWIENAFIGERRYVQVSAPTAEVRAAAAPTAALVFEAQRGVLLEVTGPVAEGWLPVRHRDGQTGFLRTAQAWGA